MFGQDGAEMYVFNILRLYIKCSKLCNLNTVMISSATICHYMCTSVDSTLCTEHNLVQYNSCTVQLTIYS
jgi:hypothetical protein